MVRTFRLVQVVALGSFLAGCPSPIPGIDASGTDAGAHADVIDERDGGERADVTRTDDDAGPDGGLDAEAIDGAVDASALDAPAATDAPPVCVGLGGTDADGDGFCVPEDCDDAFAAISPGAAEICTSSSGVMPAEDENCDGVVDETCGWYFGEPHAIVEVTGGAYYLETPQLSADGLRLYFTNWTTGADSALYVSSRPALDERFGTPVTVTIPGLPPAVVRCAVSADEREVVCAAGPAGNPPVNDLYRATRASRTASFGAAARLDAVSNAESETDPFLSIDGRELWFTRTVSSGPHTMYVARRDATGSFAAPAVVTVAGAPDARTPEILADGRTLLFNRTGSHLYAASRTTTTATIFDTVVDLEPALGRPSLGHRYFPEAREMIFVSWGTWSPTGNRRSIWRVQVCRDGPCAPEPTAACPTRFTSPRSADGFHCYFRPDGTALSYDSASLACVEDSATLATIHSSEENELVGSLLSSVASTGWIGLQDSPTAETFRWATGEPLLYAAWGVSQPNLAGTGGVAMLPGSPDTWDDRARSEAMRAVCEISLWPTW